MSYRGLFPTRTGTPIGTGGERQMLDRVGAYGFRKDYRTEADGSVTMLTTKNGMPRFQNFGIGASDQEDTTTYTAYLESGKLSWVFPHQESPYKYDPAKWNFLDIPPSDQYLGYVKNAWITDTAKFTGADGDQSNYPTLKEGQESQAIGYAKVVLTDRSTPTQISLAAIKDAETKQEVGDITVMKKMVAGLFPASLFTGKMRLFMQATYGAKTAIGKYPLSVELMGTSVLLWYTAKGAKIQFGFWSNNTPGIYTAPDGTFWLMRVAMHTGAVTVTSYPITPGANIKGLVKRYKEGAFAGDEKTKVEAYIFASSVIDVSKPVVVGSHTTAAASGGAMAYGWKFNTDGDTAKIVVSTGSGAGITARWTSYTVTLNFTYADGAIGMTGSTALNGDWMDGWGTFNMFVPDSETTSAPLAHFSITSGFPRPEFGFPTTEIYGFFKEDVWVPVTVSRTQINTAQYLQKWSGGLRFASFLTPESLTNAYQYGYTAADEGFSYESHNITSATYMDLTIGGEAYIGKQESGTHVYVTRTVTPGGTFPNAVSFTAQQVGAGTWFDGPPPGYTSYAGGNVVSAFVEFENISYVGSEFRVWSLVIPAGDCEAAFAATRATTTAPTATRDYYTNGAGIALFTGPGYSYAPWAATYVGGNGWYSSYGPGLTTSSTAIPPPELDPVKIFCHTTALSNAQGTPAHSYSSIFSVDYTYPYYDPGMYSLTSYGKRYDISEGLTSHPSVGDQPRFVGWA